MSGFYTARGIQTTALENTAFLKRGAIVCFLAAAVAAALSVILFFVFDIKKILQIKTGKARRKMIREMEKKNKESRPGSGKPGFTKTEAGKNTLLLLVIVLALQIMPVYSAISDDRAKAALLIAGSSAGTERASGTALPEVSSSAGTEKASGTQASETRGIDGSDDTAGGGTDRDSEESPEIGGMSSSERTGRGDEDKVRESSREENGSGGKTTENASAPTKSPSENDIPGSGSEKREAADKKTADKEAANEEAADKGFTDKEAANEEAADKGFTDKEAANEEAADKESTDKEAAEEGIADKEAANKDTADKETSDETGAGTAQEVNKSTGRKAADHDAGERIGNGKGDTESADTEPPFLPMIEVKARGNTRVQKFPVTGQSGELKMEGAARDYEVILYADDNPEEGFSGLRFAEFRLEPANGGGGTLEAVVPFGANSVSPEQAGEERSAVSTPRTLISGENPLFPSAKKNGSYILRTAVIDYKGNRSSACSIRLEIDSTPPKVEVSLPERGKTASWPAYRRSDNCAVDIMIREKNLSRFSIRIGSLSITQDNVNKNWISKDEKAGTTVLSIPAAEVVKNEDGKIEVSASVLDDASLKTEELEKIDPDMLEVRDQNGNLTAAAFILDTAPPVIQVGHRVAVGLTGETGNTGEGEAGHAAEEAGADISDGKAAFLYGDREGERDLTLYSRSPVATMVTVTDQSGGEEVIPDRDLIDARVYWKLPGEGSYTKHKLENTTGEGSSGKKWETEFVCGEGTEGSFYFSVKAVDRAGNEAQTGIGTHSGGREDGTGSSQGGNEDGSGNGSVGGSAGGYADGFSGGTAGQEHAFIKNYKESLAPEEVSDCRKGSDGSGYPALDQEVQSLFTIVIDRTAPELYLGYESSAVSHLYNGKKAVTPGGATAMDFPPVDAYLNNTLTAIGEIRSEEHADPDRVFFLVSKSSGGETEETVRRVSFRGSTKRAEFKTDGDGRYICVLYGTDKAGNAARVCEQLESDYAIEEEAVKIKSLMTEGCGEGYSPYFAFSVDTRSPEADFLYSADSGQVYLYEESRVGDVAEAGEAAGPSVTAVSNRKIAPQVTFRDQNILDEIRLELLEFRGETSRKMSCRKKELIPAGGDSDGNVLRAASIPGLDGDRCCAFYAVRGTDRAGNSVRMNEKFGRGTKVTPEGTAVSAAGAEESGWQVTGYLLEVDQVSPRVSMTFTAGKNENRIYLYREKKKEGMPGISAYYNGTIKPSISVTENGIIDPDRLEIFEHVFVNNSAGSPSDHTADQGRKLEFDCTEDPEDRGEKNIREVGNLTVLEADGTTAFFTVRGTDRAGNPVVIERDEITDPKKACGQGPDGGTLKSYASGQDRKVDPAEPVYRSHLLFVIDRTCPEIELTYSSSACAYIYADRGENGTRERAGTKQAPQGEEDHLFAFLADTALIKAKITNREEHIDPARLICCCSDGTGNTAEYSGWEAVDGEIILKAVREGDYEYSVRGTDKAGNAAAVTENFTGPASDRTGGKLSGRNGWKKRTEGCSESFSPWFTIIIDRTAPRITLEYRNVYSSRQQDTAGKIPRAYIYDDRGKIFREDGYVEGGLSVYVSGRTDVTLFLEEKDPDPGRLFFSRSCTVTDPFSGKKRKTEKKASWKGKGISFSPASASGDGEYRFGAYGTDRAGNPAVVSERFAPGTRLERRMVSGGDGTFRTSIRQTRQEKEYRSLFTIVIDRTAPEYAFRINLPENLEEAFDRTRGKETVYYGRAVSSVRASYTVTEQNFDAERILSEISFTGSGGHGESDTETAQTGRKTAGALSSAQTGR